MARATKRSVPPAYFSPIHIYFQFSSDNAHFCLVGYHTGHFFPNSITFFALNAPSTQRNPSLVPVIMITNFKFLVEALALSVFMSMKTTEAASTSTSWTAEKLTEMITDIKGEDERLVRWDAGDRTFERQSDGACDILPEIATDVIVNNDGDLLLQRLACEFATL